MDRSVIYKAYIELPGLNVPVRFHSAVRSERVRFRLLHADDGQPLERRMVCPKHEKPIPQEERARGYEVARGEFVVLNRDELAELRPESSRRIEVLKFVDAAEIDPRMLDRPYYLGPDAESECTRWVSGIHIKVGVRIRSLDLVWPHNANNRTTEAAISTQYRLIFLVVPASDRLSLDAS